MTVVGQKRKKHGPQKASGLISIGWGKKQTLNLAYGGRIGVGEGMRGEIRRAGRTTESSKRMDY